MDRWSIYRDGELYAMGATPHGAASMIAGLILPTDRPTDFRLTFEPAAVLAETPQGQT